MFLLPWSVPLTRLELIEPSGLGVFPLTSPFTSLELIGLQVVLFPWSVPLTKLELIDLGALPLTSPLSRLELISLQVFLLPWSVSSHETGAD